MKRLSQKQIEDVASVITSMYEENNNFENPDIYEEVVNYVSDMDSGLCEDN